MLEFNKSEIECRVKKTNAFFEIKAAHQIKLYKKYAFPFCLDLAVGS